MCKIQSFPNSPDQALIKMKTRIEKFSNYIRPICLATKDIEERPRCPDNSRDRRKIETHIENHNLNCLVPNEEETSENRGRKKRL